MEITITFQQILNVLFVIYIIIVVGVIVLDNRTPQSTFAWLFLMITFPIVGFIIYIMFGRGYKAFSNEGKLARVGVGGLSSEGDGALIGSSEKLCGKSQTRKTRSRIAKNCYLLYSATHSHY